MLARVGVGHLFLVDFDKVEPHNLNRQHYDTTHIGLDKTDALRAQMTRINPYVNIDTRTVRIDETNARGLFDGYNIVCEAFDRAESKAFLTSALLEHGEVKVVSASGMAGCGDANGIKTVKAMKNLYLCGDSLPSEHGDVGFMAPRVSICAGHQANMVIRILLGLED
jgi:sulfur carrier protein ThiS adenylyltransferase